MERQGPVLIDLEGEPAAAPALAAPVPDAPEQSAAMQRLAVLAATRPSSALGRWFWRLLAAILGFLASYAGWTFVTGLIAANPPLGYAAALLFGAFLAVCLGLALREWAAFARLARLDHLQRQAALALTGADLTAARALSDGVLRLYADRPELSWGRDRLAARQGELMDADGLLTLTEAELMEPLDQAARREIEAAARQLAVVTAVVPLALADVATALAANLRMIRRIAEIYGGRSGALGSWRLVRSVFAHLVATGAVAVTDDLVSSVAGGGLVSKLSRRFGEGIVNAALTARVGIAAVEVCRPLPFRALRRPSVSGILGRALTGLSGLG